MLGVKVPVALSNLSKSARVQFHASKVRNTYCFGLNNSVLHALIWSVGPRSGRVDDSIDNGMGNVHTWVCQWEAKAEIIHFTNLVARTRGQEIGRRRGAQISQLRKSQTVLIP